MNKNNIATLLFDLLSEEEQAFDSQLDNMISKIPGAVLNKFNVSLLAKRLSMATEWVMSNPSTEKLQVILLQVLAGQPHSIDYLKIDFLPGLFVKTTLYILLLHKIYS